MTVCVGLHIPKCAGTTILKRVQSCLPEHQIYQNTSMHENFMLGRPEIMQMPRQDHLRFVWGHSIHEEILKYFNKHVFLFTGMREPQARLESMYLYHVRIARALNNEPLPLERFLEVTRDPMCHFLIERFPTLAGADGSSFERAKNVINFFDFIYFSESLENAADMIFSILDISPDKVDHNRRPSEELENRAEIPISCISEDIQLFNYAKKEFTSVDNRDALLNRSREMDVLRKERLHGWPREEKLAEFLYNAAQREYRDWGEYQDVINTRKSQIRALSLELATYAKQSNE